MLEALRLGVAMYKQLAWHPQNKEILKTIRQSLGTKNQISVIQWSMFGKHLGVFDIDKKSNL